MNENEKEEALEQETPTIEIDPLKMQQLLQKMRDEQNLMLGIAAGAAAALISAILWAVITALTNYQIGWMAIGVGVLVGLAVRSAGKGVDTSFGVVGGILSALGFALGNLLTVVIMVSNTQNIAIFDLVSQLTPSTIVEVMKATFQPMDVVFYLIGLYEGYQFSFRQLTDEEIMSVAQEPSEGI